MRSKKKLTQQEVVASDVKRAVEQAVDRFGGDRYLWHQFAKERYPDLPEWRTIYDYMSRNSYRDAAIYESLKRACELSPGEKAQPSDDQTFSTVGHSSSADADDQHFFHFWRPTVGGTKLDLTGTRVGDRWLGLLAARRERLGIRWLSLANTKVTDAGMVHLNGLDLLNALVLDYTPISKAGIAQLKDLTHLEYLYLCGTDLEDEGIKFIRKFRRLRELSLSRAKVGPEGIKHLRGLKHLQKLWLDGLNESGTSGLSHNDLKPLLTLTSLRVLALTGSRIGDEGLRMLVTHLKSLQELYLEETGVSDDGLGHLLKVKNTLQAISLNYNVLVSDTGVTKMKGLRCLRYLYLNGTMVSDESLAELTCLRLSEIGLENTSIKDSRTLRRLQQLFPDTKIKV